ncbi:hypothetical protein BGY98DRAFT_668940 [Russula aff. rugulosa BPL654]|nr:hypothetical protein BGY98DRAFT_668940 [Russula aff. rugulosa BPL654]
MRFLFKTTVYYPRTFLLAVPIIDLSMLTLTCGRPPFGEIELLIPLTVIYYKHLHTRSGTLRRGRTRRIRNWKRSSKSLCLVFHQFDIINQFGIKFRPYLSFLRCFPL